MIYKLYEGGHHYDSVEAESCDAALDLAASNVDAANYEVDTTLWIDVEARCDATGERGSRTVALDPEEPKCSEQSHDWQSPHAIVGGIVENPGVWGHGAGVIVTECCMTCGCARITDTWAQNPSNGVQGLRSVRYEPKRFADQINEL